MPELLSLAEAARLLGVDSAEVIRKFYRDERQGVVEQGHLKVPADQDALEKPAQT